MEKGPTGSRAAAAIWLDGTKLTSGNQGISFVVENTNRACSNLSRRRFVSDASNCGTMVRRYADGYCTMRDPLARLVERSRGKPARVEELMERGMTKLQFSCEPWSEENDSLCGFKPITAFEGQSILRRLGREASDHRVKDLAWMLVKERKAEVGLSGELR